MSSHVEPNHGCYLMWCDVMSCHPVSCQVCHDMISISCHVTSLYVILYYFWLRLITSSHLLSVRDVVLNVSFLLQVLELLQRCIWVIDSLENSISIKASVAIYFAEYLERASESVPNTSPTNVTEHPALSINAGFSDGLPVGMMIVGTKLDEATILNVARAYEKIRDTTFEPF